MLGAGELNQAQTMICSSNYDKQHTVFVTFLFLLVALLLIATFGFILVYSKKIQLFPLKGRAPRLSLIQMIYFVLLNFIPFFIEFLMILGVRWEDDSNPQKHFLAKDFLKALYTLIRLSCNLLYIQRYPPLTQYSHHLFQLASIDADPEGVALLERPGQGEERHPGSLRSPSSSCSPSSDSTSCSSAAPNSTTPVCAPWTPTSPATNSPTRY